MKNRISFLRVLSCIAVLVLALVMVVGTTFSWYDRSQKQGKTANLMEYKLTSAKVNGSGCTFATYLGTDTNGIVEYSDTAATGTVTLNKGELTYFKTVITNGTNTGMAVVSLNLKNAPVSSSIHIGVTEPEKTYKPFTGIDNSTNSTVVCIEDNIDLIYNGTQDVYWFIDVPASYSGTVEINPSNLYVTYN